MRNNISYVYIEWSNNRFLFECVGGYILYLEIDIVIFFRRYEDSRFSSSLGIELLINNYYKMYVSYR